MSSQSAKLRTTHSAGVNLWNTPTTSSGDFEKAKRSGDVLKGARREDERVSWGWVAAIGAGTWVLLAYVVPAVADFLASLAF